MNKLKTIGVVIIAFIFILVSFDAEGQRYRKRYNKRGPNVDIRVGLRSGANLSSFSGDEFTFIRENGIQVSPFPERMYDFSLGYHGGFYLDALLTRGIHLQPEINYTRIGAKFSTPISIPMMMGAPLMKSFETEILIDYLQFGLLTKIGLGKDDKFRFLVGPGVGFKNSELIVYTYPTEVDEQDRLTSPTFNVFNGTDIFAIGGFEYQMDLGINIGFRFMQGFNDVYETPVTSSFMQTSQEPLEVFPQNFNRSFQLSIGYTFNHYKRLFLTRKGRRFTFKKRRF